jgi:hypothetical protein
MDTRDTTPVLPAPKSSRTVRLLDMGEGRRALVMRFATPKTLRETRYHLTRLDCEDVAFEVRKFSCDLGPDESGEPYHVNLTAGSCDCVGHLRHGHRTVCRHLAAVRALCERGAL